jgi:hypothetical protein
MTMTMTTTFWKRLSMVLLAVLALALVVTRAWAVPQPNMESALAHLENARAELQRAAHNKGGYRRAAIGKIDQAVAAVRQGIAVGNQ